MSLTSVCLADVVAGRQVAKPELGPGFFRSQRMHCAPILHEFNSWAVTSFGVENLIGPYHYFIEKEVIHGDLGHWLGHVSAKPWVNREDFESAIFKAREVFPDVAIRVNNTRKISRKGLSLRVRYLVLKRDKFKCRLCGADAETGGGIEVDHIVPVCKGGGNGIENLRTLCKRCNLGKGGLSE